MLVVDVEIKIAMMVLVAELVINNLAEQYINGRCNNLVESYQQKLWIANEQFWQRPIIAVS